MLSFIGGPVVVGPYANKRDSSVFFDWSNSLVALAVCPNVYVKIGGLGMPIFGLGDRFNDRFIKGKFSVLIF